MRHLTIKHVVFFLAFALVFAYPGLAQDDCKVLLEDIAGEYEGGCKKGLADGEGTAKGTDSYTGDFKKGLPHGTGTYTWANGDVYVGEFKKGQKDGAGTLTVNLGGGQKKEQPGYWAKDEYIGENESPYEVISFTPGVMSARLNETENPANDGNALFIEILRNGARTQSPSFGFNIINGTIRDRYLVGNITKILVARFPFGFTLNYMGETVEIQVYQEKSWNIRLDFR